MKEDLVIDPVKHLFDVEDDGGCFVVVVEGYTNLVDNIDQL